MSFCNSSSDSFLWVSFLSSKTNNIHMLRKQCSRKSHRFKHKYIHCQQQEARNLLLNYYADMKHVYEVSWRTDTRRLCCCLWFSCSVMFNSLQPWSVGSPGSFVHGISQAQILEWVAITFSRVNLYFLILCACKLSRLSRVWLFATLWTVAHQAPLSMGFSRQEYWSGLPYPPQGLFSQGWNPCLLPLLQGSLPLAPPGKPIF